MPIRPKRFSAGGVSSLAVSARAFLTTIVAGSEIAKLSRPFGAGTVFSTVGGVPGQLALAGGSIVAGASAPLGEQIYTVTVRAASADGQKAIEVALGFVALTPIVISGAAPDAIVGQAYEYQLTANGPVEVHPSSLAAIAELATHNIIFDAAEKRFVSTGVGA